MPLSYFPDHTQRALRETLSVLRDRPRVRALIEAIMFGVQAVEDESLNTLLAFNLNTAEGDQLNILADVVGEQRGAFTDTELRRIVRARIAANRSNGSIADVYRVFELATTGPDPSDRAFAFDQYPASFTLLVESVRVLTIEEKQRAARLVRVAKPAGVGDRLLQGLPGALRFHPRGSGRATFDGPPFSSLFPPAP